MTRILAYPDDDYVIDEPPVDKVWCSQCGLHAAPNGYPQHCPCCKDTAETVRAATAWAVRNAEGRTPAPTNDGIRQTPPTEEVA